jgi:hypothetical protein
MASQVTSFHWQALEYSENDSTVKGKDLLQPSSPWIDLLFQCFCSLLQGQTGRDEHPTKATLLQNSITQNLRCPLEVSCCSSLPSLPSYSRDPNPGQRPGKEKAPALSVASDLRKRCNISPFKGTNEGASDDMEEDSSSSHKRHRAPIGDPNTAGPSNPGPMMQAPPPAPPLPFPPREELGMPAKEIEAAAAAAARAEERPHIQWETVPIHTDLANLKAMSADFLKAFGKGKLKLEMDETEVFGVARDINGRYLLDSCVGYQAPNPGSRPPGLQVCSSLTCPWCARIAIFKGRTRACRPLQIISPALLNPWQELAVCGSTGTTRVAKVENPALLDQRCKTATFTHRQKILQPG